jgi:hypothetical protein
MLADASHRRILLGLAIVSGVLVVLSLALGVGLTIRFLRAADYPGAVPVSDHTLSRLTPVIYFQRNTSYRTSDRFPDVYNWYSQTFDLGPEARAQSACITMERAAAWLVFERMTTVTVCDASTGRLIFVQRFVLVRLPRP